ncbi:phosphomethylpyrimidine synthase [Methanothermobacter sp. KEPCO-1]|uniref:Phosphomethylpyrimidine synthase n=1 Tax=Methanothermobacter marburgensis (strain ATCC BAA-927 / DSM 2133 / JCM 14651 / NBRC 100331 / OCM 82 / Marburg) TaxID=79929 RepID=D9PU73_METTM|nr:MULTISPECIES: phosphomethylpyrimidine synthase [Methanothermobacter]ADL57771.1 thiamine biosynthesis protein [Methanothermobacter marburgensis str. Marburg]QEF94345.1 phosphomethylpyrimidine synthase [Methanothermobacter sp. KEPCO-1]WBF09989.1 phosphomethylpyrimidine synthase [Methanothermobacter marburgensis]
MTQMEDARKGNITPEMEEVARKENIDIQILIKSIADGRTVIPSNVNRSSSPCGIGEGLSTKINANIGSSSKMEDIDLEVEKAMAAVEYGADAVMDLSTGPMLREVRRAVLEAVDVPVGTVPIYEAGVEVFRSSGSVVDMDEDDMFRAIENQARDGVDFMTVHSGITLETVERVQRSDRIMGIVSRGGAFLAAWIIHNQEENPLYSNYDYLLELAYEYDVTLSLGDGLRPGCLADASDIPQIQELLTLADLVSRARDADVQCMVEGPGHMPLDQIAANMKIQKSVCDGAPFYVLGPIVTDMAPGYDHISAAIGGAVAAMNGADFLCYVTPAEHLAIPGVEDVIEGVVASRIAAQAADAASKLSGAWKSELEMANARKSFDWDKQFEMAFDSRKPAEYRMQCPIDDSEMCTMCGEYCALRILRGD